MFFETSAKTALNVEAAFMATTQKILENIEKGEYDLSNEVTNSFNLQSIGIKPGNAAPYLPKDNRRGNNNSLNRAKKAKKSGCCN